MTPEVAHDIIHTRGFRFYLDTEEIPREVDEKVTCEVLYYNYLSPESREPIDVEMPKDSLLRQAKKNLKNEIDKIDTEYNRAYLNADNPDHVLSYYEDNYREIIMDYLKDETDWKILQID